ncbi:RICIN domain-containing protein [Streptomyces tailanensis]|uniref:RICIN domain-containing protein n=1 Tax=Streptomyces tailanensis TaxID=2569858 RepID=UPI00155A75C1|nr:ricin-type beta-trefoil lectin domain protein [Streptomyces tailanensis]
MQKSVRALVIASAAAAAVTAGALAPANAAETGANAYNNVRLVKVWGNIGGKDICMTMAGKTNNNAPAKIAKCGGNSTQKWTLKRLSSTSQFFTVKNTKSKKCLGVSKKTNGTVVTQRPCKASDKKQHWALGGSLIISRYAGNKAITAEKNKNGLNLTISTYNDSNSKRAKQEWGTD